MSDDLSKVVFGEAIHPGGMRPEGIENDCLILWSNNGKPWKEVHVCNVRNWGDHDNDVSIRLPADHAFYRLAPETAPMWIRNDFQAYVGNPIADPIAKRMEALVRALDAQDHNIEIGSPFWALSVEAAAIVALLPEPVDADLVEAREICAEASIRAGQPQQAEEYRAGKWDAGYTIEVAKIALRRALQRDSREG